MEMQAFSWSDNSFSIPGPFYAFGLLPVWAFAPNSDIAPSRSWAGPSCFCGLHLCYRGFPSLCQPQSKKYVGRNMDMFVFSEYTILYKSPGLPHYLYVNVSAQTIKRLEQCVPSAPKRKLRTLGARQGWWGFLYTSESLSVSRAKVEIKF